jgi:hypothetical protein
MAVGQPTCNVLVMPERGVPQARFGAHSMSGYPTLIFLGYTKSANADAQGGPAAALRRSLAAAHGRRN